MNRSFDIAVALATWRQFMRRNPAVSNADLDELEVHLLDHVDSLRLEGHADEEAFRMAVHRLGGYDELESEYGKVRFGRTKRRASMHTTRLMTMDILSTFLRTGLRNFKRHAGVTGINLVGLAIGLAAVLLISLFVVDELRYDTQYDGEHLYRIGNATTGWPYGQLIAETYPDVEAVTYLRTYPGLSIKHDGQYTYPHLLYADDQFLPMFDIPVAGGDPATALAAPYTTVLTEGLARRLFGTVDVVGRTLVMNDSLDVTVTGVTPDPRRSHLDFELLVSLQTLIALDPEAYEQRMAQGWLDLNAITYVRLSEGANAEALEAEVADLPMRQVGDLMRQWGVNYELTLHPVSEIYLDPAVHNAAGPTSSIDFVYLLSAIAAFLLLLAMVNFVNLATARATERAREVGIRKVAGSSRSLLVFQFMSEAILMTTMAMTAALLLAVVLLPVFNDMAGKDFLRTDLLAPGVLATLFGASLLVGILAGLYPAVVLSRFAPARVLKGRLDASRSGVGLRKALVVFQFAVSAGIILGTLLVNNQIRFMQEADLGFDAGQVLVIDAGQVPRSTLRAQNETLKSALMAHPGVYSVSGSFAVPGRSGWRGQISFPEGWDADRSMSLEYIGVDAGYFATLGLEVIAGRAFEDGNSVDARESVIINEAAVREVGWGSPEEAIGKSFTSPGSGKPDGRVIGVVRDHHQHGLRERVEPIMYGMTTSGSLRLVRFEPSQAASVLEHVADTWASVMPEFTQETVFLDDDFAKQYAKEEQLRLISGAFSILAVLIACLGLFGLVAYETSRRTKEIGIRKVLGASTREIVVMLSRQVVVLVMAGYALAIPLVWWGVTRWQAGFAYHAPISIPWIVVGGVVLAVLAVVTSGQQALRAATARPAQSIRSE